VRMTEAFNSPPYHAGRFFLTDDIVPDPVRMITKALVKQTEDMDRANQLAEAFYDRYVALTDRTYALLQRYIVEAYSDFEPEFGLAALDLYHALRDRSLFYELLVVGEASEDRKLVVVDKEEQCIRFAASLFVNDRAFLDVISNETIEVVEYHLNRFGIPNYRVAGKPNDFLRRGVWLTVDHAWAVLGMTEFKEKEEQIENYNDNGSNTGQQRRNYGGIEEAVDC